MTVARTTAVLAAVVVAASLSAAAPAGAGPSAASDVAAVPRATVSDLAPPVVDKPIPFPLRRKLQMARYSERHYGHHRYRLTAPRAVVEHYTDGPSMMSAWWTMAGNTRNLGELPGVCTHFIVDTDGRIYATVPLRLRCRHTIGLNQTAIGIEHVGTSDAGVMHDRRQRRASLRLTLWLIARYDIPVRNVIGHGESLMSPLRHERYPAWRCLTHTDFSHATMQVYRERLRARAVAAGVPVGPRPRWVDLGC
jgi:N-acetylmuramoyl-L-alanine amidase